jgi:hypothetical protein
MEINWVNSEQILQPCIYRLLARYGFWIEKYYLKHECGRAVWTDVSSRNLFAFTEM